MPAIENTLSKRLWRYQKDGVIFTRRIKLGKSGTKTLERMLGKCARKMYQQDFQDHLKAPVNNEARSAKLAPAAFNFYYGINTENTEDPTTVNRAAYGLGSGATSIGLDPRTMRLNPFNTELMNLRDRIHKILIKDPTWKAAMKGKSLNSCSAKMYYWIVNEAGKDVRKDVKYHVDVTRNSNGVPDKNNSQVPDTPVVIVTFGDEKRFNMRRHYSASEVVHNSKVEFRQKSATVIVLDGRDEQVRNGIHWRHTSRAGDNKDDVTFSFMFRVVQMQQEVRLDDATLVNKTCGAKKMAQFKRAGKIPFKKAHYKRTVNEINRKVELLFNRFP
jgi:hypothetical protein